MILIEWIPIAEISGVTATTSHVSMYCCYDFLFGYSWAYSLPINLPQCWTHTNSQRHTLITSIRVTRTRRTLLWIVLICIGPVNNTHVISNKEMRRERASHSVRQIWDTIHVEQIASYLSSLHESTRRVRFMSVEISQLEAEYIYCIHCHSPRLRSKWNGNSSREMALRTLFPIRYLFYYEIVIRQTQNYLLTLNLRSPTGTFAYGMPLNEKYFVFRKMVSSCWPRTGPLSVCTIPSITTLLSSHRLVFTADSRQPTADN